MMKTSFLSATLAAFAALAACTTPNSETSSRETTALTDQKPDPRQGAEVRSICFTSSISGFTRATNTGVVVSRGMKDYLVTTRGRCPDLDGANSLAFDDTTGCLSRGDRLIAFDSAFGENIGSPTSVPCYIDRIYLWNKDAVAAPEATETDPG